MALIALGRSWHTELNAPIYKAIDALSESLFAYSSDLLERDLLTGNTTLPTLHASGSLSNAQACWSKILNYPGGDHKSGHGSSSSYHRRRRRVSLSARRALALYFKPANENGNPEAVHTLPTSPRGPSDPVVNPHRPHRRGPHRRRRQLVTEDGVNTGAAPASDPRPRLQYRRHGTIPGRSIVPWA
ncbi:uncharacterized protein BDZ99DRAFT_464528 [Mytilinidion resinicola]|uniref:Uncharacterized protein n=1 Tax=Mytilinidion resinicola TaxID=574789 RepID=A0A6A6YFM1_9PEZI|nr:uncharacterized protein BDZ99DRAFT_464528 [Mytilinidion resinicola]KAF2807592.1 hypothetical protein BDZ99DRAFT_464528 [Mytilinidion resinicola]